jgi:hypothetical protein
LKATPAASPKLPATRRVRGAELRGDLAARLPLDYRRNCGLVRFFPDGRADFPMAELLARLRRFRPIFDARPQSPPALADLLAFGLAPNLQRQIYILNRHNARIYALAWRLGAKGGLPRKLRLQLRAPRRRVGRPPLPRLLIGERHKIGAFSNSQGLAAILAAFFMRRPARLGEMPGPLPRKRLDLPALERRQALKRPAFCATLALIHRDPPLHFFYAN